MSNKDKMREEFYKTFPKFAGIMEMEDAGAIGHLDAMTARHHFAVWKACAAIKDAEIAEINSRRNDDLMVIINLQESARFWQDKAGQFSEEIVEVKERVDLGKKLLIEQMDFATERTKIIIDLRSELEELKQLHSIELAEYRVEIASRDLMIQELREALMGISNIRSEFSNVELIKNKAEKALAKTEHHDSSALEKMLLENSIHVLNTVWNLNEWGGIYSLLRAQEAKLAELNKEK
jgi:hypothetical protein